MKGVALLPSVAERPEEGSVEKLPEVSLLAAQVAKELDEVYLPFASKARNTDDGRTS